MQRTSCFIVALLILALLLALAAPALALDPADGYGSLTVTSSAAVGLPAAKVVKNGIYARTCLVQVETAAIRERHDGGLPTTAEGFLWQPGEAFVLTEKEIDNFRAIATGANATVRYGCSY